MVTRIEFMRSERESEEDPIPLRRMEKPAPVVVLNRTSRTARCLAAGRLTIWFARWKASEKPNPSIVWKVLEVSIVSVVARFWMEDDAKMRGRAGKRMRGRVYILAVVLWSVGRGNREIFYLTGLGKRN